MVIILLLSHVFQLLLGNCVIPPVCYGVERAEKTSRCMNQLKAAGYTLSSFQMSGLLTVSLKVSPDTLRKRLISAPCNCNLILLVTQKPKRPPRADERGWGLERKLTSKCDLLLTAVSPHLCLPQSFCFLLYWVQDTMLPRLHHVRP